MITDFSFVKDELYNLKDVPRTFDDVLYLKLGVSSTVIDYWRNIAYIPPYYYQFWILIRNQRDFSFDEYRGYRDMLIPGICQENEKIGDALRQYAGYEDEAYDRFIQYDGKHMYFLYESYDDGGDDIIMASVYYDKIISGIRQEVEDNKKRSYDVSYLVTKYPILMSEDNKQVVGLDIDDHCGQFWFNEEGIHWSMSVMEGFPYEDMDTLYLLEPYIFVPHPFKTGDIVKFLYHEEEYEYGVLYYAADKDDRVEDETFLGKDGSDFSTTVLTIYYDTKEGDYVSDHDHICPLFLERVDDNEELEDDLKILLSEASRIMLEDKKNSFYRVESYLEKYNEDRRKRWLDFS